MRLYTTVWNINVRKTLVAASVLVNEKKTLKTKIEVNDLYNATLC